MKREFFIHRIVSGGQTGVDRAALDTGLAFGLPIGGWCPRDRIAEDGVIHRRYPLRETPRKTPAQRTTWNVRDSDGTLIVTRGTPRGGTALTITTAQLFHKPHLIIDPANLNSAVTTIRWIKATDIHTLNIAGPRESSEPGIYGMTLEFLARIFSQSKDENLPSD